MTPSKATNHVEPVFKFQPRVPVPAVSKIIEKNIFHPDRGKIPKPDAEPLKPPKDLAKLELVGIFKLSDNVGAIIKDSTPSKNKDQKTNKTVFKVGETLPSGFILKEIDKKSVTLDYQGSLHTLEISFSDAASQKRNETAANQKDKTVAESNKALANMIKPAYAVQGNTGDTKNNQNAPKAPPILPPGTTVPPVVLSVVPPDPNANQATGIQPTPTVPVPPVDNPNQIRRGRFFQR